MAHCHLTFDLTCCFDYNAYYDDDGGTAECETAHNTAAAEVDDHRNNSNEAEEDCTDKGNSVKNTCDVI